MLFFRENVQTLSSNYSSVKKELEMKNQKLLQTEKDLNKLKKEREVCSRFV